MRNILLSTAGALTLVLAAPAFGQSNPPDTASTASDPAADASHENATDAQSTKKDEHKGDHQAPGATGSGSTDPNGNGTPQPSDGTSSDSSSTPPSAPQL